MNRLRSEVFHGWLVSGLLAVGLMTALPNAGSAQSLTLARGSLRTIYSDGPIVDPTGGILNCDLVNVGCPEGVAVDAAGDVFIADSYSAKVIELPANGGAQILIGSGWGRPRGVAVDSAGNVYVSDDTRDEIAKVTPAGVKSILANNAEGVLGPVGITVDPAGDVFVANLGAKNVLGLYANGAISPVATGLNAPTGVAADKAGNVYVADYAAATVTKYAAVGGAVTQIGIGWTAPFGVSLDPLGNIYVADYGAATVVELPVNGGPYDTIASGLGGPTAVAVDTAGNVFIADFNFVRVADSPLAIPQFGNVNVCPAGACAQTQTLTFNVNSSVSIGSTNVLTNGAGNLDYTLASGSTCTGSVTAGTTCTVNVSFAPQYAGLREGAVQILDGGGKLLGSTFLQGTGVGAQVTFSPGAPTTVGTGLSGPKAVALDASGNAYLADKTLGVVKAPIAGGRQTQIGTGIGSASGVAVDGAGNVFIVDQANGLVSEVPATGAAQTTVVSSLSSPSAAAVDGSGNLYVADPGNNRVLEVVSATGSQLPIGTGLSSPQGVAVDAAGDVFVADTGNNRVVEIPATGGAQIVIASSLNAPSGVAVDAAGDVYIADTGNNRVLEIPAGTSPQIVIPTGTTLNAPLSVALDAAGDIFIVDSGNTRVLELQTSQTPTLTFSSTAPGQTSSDSPKSVTVSNIGNTPLTITGLAIIGLTNSGNFTLVAGTGTPADCTSSSTLSQGASCNVSISFTPTGSGSLSTAAVLTDNALGRNPAMQSINLRGQTSQVTPTLTFAPITPQTGGTTLALTATTNSTSPVAFSSATPSVCSVTFGVASFNTAGGTCTLTASVAANSNYASASVSQSFTVLAIPTFTFNSLPAAIALGSATLSVTTNSSSPVVFGSTSPAVCTVSGNKVSYLTNGSCVLSASVVSDGVYAAATATQTVTVGGAAATLTFNTVAPGTALGSATLSATTNSTSSVVFSSTSPSVCSVNGNQVSYLTAGNCLLSASVAATNVYGSASATQTVTVAPAATTLTFAPVAAATALSSATLSATTNSTAPVVFSSTSPAVCTVSGNTVSYLTSGSCLLSASVPAAGAYSSASASQSVTVGLQGQTITFNTVTPQSVGGSLSLGATTTSTLTIAYTSSTPAVCTVTGGVATFLTPGTCSITATQPGDGVVYSAATSVTQSFRVNTTTLGVTLQSLLSQLNAASANVCASGTAGCSQALSLSYTLTDSGTLGTPVVLTDGVPNLDFTLASGSTCSGSVTGGNSCSVNITFTPRYPGLRKGAVNIVDGSGNILSTTYISGTGVAPEAAFSSATQTTLGSNLQAPHAAAIDAAGNTYVADATLGLVKIPAGGGAQTTLATGFGNPSGVAVDGAGNIFVVDQANNQVAEVPNAGGASTAVVTGLKSPSGIAIDGAGNLYVADTGNNRVVEVPIGGGPQIVLGTGFASPKSVAVDAAGDVFVADTGNNQVVELPAGGGQINVATNLSAPQGVSVDAAGDIIIADTGNNRIYEIPADGPPLTVGTGFTTPYSVAVDGAGNVFVADFGNTRVVEVQRSQAATLSFAATAVNSTSTDSPQSLSFQNIGNAALSASNLVIPSNFTQVAGNGTPADCNTKFSLPAGASCNLSISFAPTTSGAANVSATLTDNSLNVAGATQSVPLTGNALGNQTINFPAISTQTVGTPLALSATSSSGAAVSFASTTPLVCTVSNNTATFLSVGTCMITASVPATSTYAGVSQTVSFGVQLASQTITFNQPASQAVGTPLTLAATSTSSTPITYTSNSAAVCAVNGSTASFLAAGTCSITASQAATSTYAAASVTQTFTVFANQTINFAQPATQIVGTPLALVATATSKLAVSFASTTPSVCTVSNTTASFLTAGTCSITASQAGDGVTYLAATPVTQSFLVLGTQTITFANPGTQLAGTTLNLSATATSGLPVSYQAIGASCSVNGATASFSAPGGSCTITASQAGNGTTFTAASPVSQTFNVNVTPTITWAPIANQAVGGSLALNATSNSPGALTYSSSTTSVCTVSGTTAKFLTSGMCNLTVSQAASGYYTAATAMNNFGVGAGMQGITWNPIGNQTVGAKLILNASASSGLAVTFSSSTPTTCTVTGTTASFIAAGSCSITASQLGNSNFKPATPVTQTITVGKEAQTITWATIPTGTVGGSVALSATASSGLTPITFTSSTASVCTVSGTTASLVGSGTCTITASQAGNANYASVTLSQSFTVHGKAQTITFNAIPTEPVNTKVTLSATASSGLAVTFTSSTPAVCTVSGTTASLIGGGQCTIVATQAGTSVWAPATASQTFTVSKLPQTVTFTPVPPQTVNTTVTLSATASTGLAVTFTSLTPAVCTVSGNKATLIAGGDCSIEATQAGTSIYASANAIQCFRVNKLAQSITFGSIAAQKAGTTLTLKATASSGLTVTYTAFPAEVCTVSGSTVSNVGGGLCTIVASQVGNGVYAPAPPVPQSFVIAKLSQTITFSSIATQKADTKLTLGATASSSLAVTYAAWPAEVCTVSGNTLTTVGGGVCVVAAFQAGNGVYTPAVPVQETFTVTKLSQTITFAGIATQKVGVPLTLNATTTSGLAITYTATPDSVCKVSGKTVTMVGAGTCTVTAAQPGDCAYNAATSVSQSFTVTN